MDRLLDVTQKQVLRGYVLRIADQAEPLGAGIEVIHGALKKEGFAEYSKDNIKDASIYLEKKGLVSLTNIKNEVLHIERCVVKITAKGIDIMEGTITEDGIELV